MRIPRRSQLPEHSNATFLTMREERLLRGLTQQQLADLVGVSKHTLHNIETGKKATFYQNVVALANALGFDMKLIRRTTP